YYAYELVGYRQDSHDWIADAKATNQVKDLQGNDLVGQGFDQVDQFAQGVQVGADFGNLRADVAVDAYDVQARKLRGALVYRRRERNINTKLVFFQPGGNVGVRVGVHEIGRAAC